MRKYMDAVGPGGSSGAAVPLGNSPGARMALARKLGNSMLVVAVLLLLAGGVGLNLLNGRIQSALKVEADKRAQVGSAQQITSRYNDTQGQYNAVEDQLRFLEKPQPQNMYVPTLLPQLQKLAQTYNCQIKSIAPGPITDAAPAQSGSSGSSGSQKSASTSSTATATGPKLSYQVMPLKLVMDGTYVQVMHVVYDLTRFPKIMALQGIALHPATGGAASAGDKAATFVEASLSLQSYVFSPTNDSTDATDGSQASSPGTTDSAPAASTGSGTEMPLAKKAISSALSVQSQTQQRVDGAGLQSEPTTPTLPTNKNLGK